VSDTGQFSAEITPPTGSILSGNQYYGDLQEPETRTDTIIDNKEHIADAIVATARRREQHLTLDIPTDDSIVTLPVSTVLGTTTLRTIAARRTGQTLVLTQGVMTGDTARIMFSVRLSSIAPSFRANIRQCVCARSSM
jgi:hypothetical protein